MIVLRFKALPGSAPPSLRFEFDGHEVRARPGQTVAAALLEAGIVATRAAPASGKPHGPYCMMGACFECLVTVDDAGTFQACLLEAADGMKITTGGGR